MTLPDTKETATVRRFALGDLAAIIAVLLTLLGAVGAVYSLRQQVADAQESNNSKHASYEHRLDSLESDAAGTRSDLAVLKDRSAQSIEWQKSLDAKLDQLLEQQHHH